jgi:DNA polymerase III alpha subunit
MASAKIDLAHPETFKPGSCILAGTIKSLRVLTDKKGTEMAFAILADNNGEIDVVFFSSIWKKCKDKIKADKAAILWGCFQAQELRMNNRDSFIAEKCLDLNETEGADESTCR